MSTIWFQLEGSTRDEVSVCVQEPLNMITVDKLKEILLEKKVLVDLPPQTQKQHMAVFLKEGDGSGDGARLPPRCIVGQVYGEQKTFIVRADGVQERRAKENEDNKPKEKKSDSSTAESTQPSTASGDTRSPDEEAKRAKRLSAKLPCSHPCIKRICKHACCKIGLEDEGSEDVTEASMSRKKRKREAGTPCTHSCHDKSLCGHKCCKEAVKEEKLHTSDKEKNDKNSKKRRRHTDGELYQDSQKIKPESGNGEIQSDSGPQKKRRRKTNMQIPCKHQCLNKRECGHMCCKIGLDDPDMADMVDTESTEEHNNSDGDTDPDGDTTAITTAVAIPAIPAIPYAEIASVDGVKRLTEAETQSRVHRPESVNADTDISEMVLEQPGELTAT